MLRWKMKPRSTTRRGARMSLDVSPVALARYVATGDRRSYIRAYVAALRRDCGMSTIQAYWLARRWWEAYQ